jgi:hypothetical protein
MSGKNTSVFGIYPTHASADTAVEMLRAKGFRNTDISVLFPQNPGSKEFGHERGTKSAEGAVAGGGTGAVIGGALGWLAGIGMLAIPASGRHCGRSHRRDAGRHERRWRHRRHDRALMDSGFRVSEACEGRMRRAAFCCLCRR